MRPEIYKIPALSLSYFGVAPSVRIELTYNKLTVCSRTLRATRNNGRRDLYVRTESPFPSSRHRILGPARGIALPTF